jgi:hypothetical protein
MSKKIFAATLSFPWNEVIVAARDKAESPEEQAVGAD